MQEKTTMPPARKAALNLRMPDPGAVHRLFELSRLTLESADYLVAQFSERVQKLPAAQQVKYADVIECIQNFRDIVLNEHSDKTEFWSGKQLDAVISKSKQYFETISVAALDALSQREELIEMQFKVGDDGDVMQGLLMNGAPCDDEDMIDQINTVYSNWLISNGMRCEKGIVFTVAKDNQSSKPVDPEDYSKKFMDKKLGFSAFVQEKAQGLKIKVTDVSERALQAGSSGAKG
jgi:hypothetical protein